MMDLGTLQVVWFVLVAVLFVGFFFLEGFDYGVGTILPFWGKNDTVRRMMINSIGPVWDGNEVWMITAGGALFAAFPHVYATMFSMLYMALFLMLLGLIVRGVAFEFRSKHENSAWRSTWDWLIFFGSAVPAFLWGVTVTNMMKGFAINGEKIYTGSFFDLLSVYTIVGGFTFVLVFAYHGISFLTLRLAEPRLVERLGSTGFRVGITAAVLYVLCMVLTVLDTDMWNSPLSAAAMILAAVSFVISVFLIYIKRLYVKAFIASSLAIVFTTVSVFAGLFPRILISTLNPSSSLTIYNASSTEYTLNIMTIAAVFFVPIVLIYQGWTYWVFRKRISRKDLNY